MELDGVDEALVGLPEAAEGEPPKKSRPIKELLGSGCLLGAEGFEGGGWMPEASVVLGLAGGDDMSPKISEFGADLCTEVVG